MNAAVEIELPDPDPDSTQAQQLNDAAMVIYKEDKYPDAAVYCMLRRALALKPNAEATAKILGNLGIVQWRAGDIDGAEQSFRQALALAPHIHSCHGNLGVFMGAVGDYDAARVFLMEADRLKPEDLAARWDMSLLSLRYGDWEEGLKHYDIRRAHRGKDLYPDMPVPIWQGEDLNGKTLYVQTEQGIGDRFIFSRYFVWLKETWPDVTIMVCLSDALISVFWEYRHILTFLPQGIPFPEGVDYAVYLCSLPERHGSRLDHVPREPGLLRKRIEIARKSTTCNLPVPNRPSIKVGIAWTGNPDQVRNRDRTVPLELMLTLAEDPRVVLYSFQCSPGQADVERCGAKELVCDLGPQIEKEGWCATGLALQEIDVLVTVCTSIAHFAGALGVRTWTMLCRDPYWIWGMDTDTTSLYPGMRLFRQRSLGDWGPVIADVRTELSKLADSVVGPEAVPVSLINA